MSGHGWVTPNPDGSVARCGGPGLCPECRAEEQAVKHEQPPKLKGRARLLEALAELGLDEAGYKKIEHARRLVDEVNAQLAQAGSPLVVAVTMQSAAPMPGRGSTVDVLE